MVVVGIVDARDDASGAVVGRMCISIVFSLLDSSCDSRMSTANIRCSRLHSLELRGVPCATLRPSLTASVSGWPKADIHLKR